MLGERTSGLWFLSLYSPSANVRLPKKWYRVSNWQNIQRYLWSEVISLFDWYTMPAKIHGKNSVSVGLSVCFIELLSLLASSTGRKPPGNSEPERIHPLDLSSSYPLPLSLSPSLSPTPFRVNSIQTTVTHACAPSKVTGRQWSLAPRKFAVAKIPHNPGKYSRAARSGRKRATASPASVCPPSTSIVSKPAILRPGDDRRGGRPHFFLLGRW